MKQRPKNREDMLAALAHNIPDEIIKANAPPESIEVIENKPSDQTVIKDSEEDYEFTRTRVKKLIETSDDAIATMLNLAQDSEHPRAYEVLANLIKTAADVNNQLTTIHKDRKKILADPVKKGDGVGNTTNNTTNAIFVGTTTELQKYLKDRKAAETTIEA